MTGKYDHEHVNFGEDYELNDHLRKHDKKVSDDNRAVLREMGEELKAQLGKRVLTHKEFDDYIKDNLDRLADPD